MLAKRRDCIKNRCGNSILKRRSPVSSGRAGKFRLDVAEQTPRSRRRGADAAEQTPRSRRRGADAAGTQSQNDKVQNDDVEGDGVAFKRKMAPPRKRGRDCVRYRVSKLSFCGGHENGTARRAFLLSGGG